MKTLSLTQPWASLVVIGAKRIETRGWNTHFRGRIAIHAAKGFPKWAKELCNAPYFAQCLEHRYVATSREGVIACLPLGAVIGEVDIIGCMRTEQLLDHREQFNLNEQEYTFGDYGPKRYGILLANPEEYPGIFPARGALGLWNWEAGK